MSPKDSKESKRTSFRQKIIHAFQVKEEVGFTEEELALLDKIAGFISRRGLEAPAIFGLVAVKPLSFLGSQLLIFLQPFLVPFFNEFDYQNLVNILSRRNGIEIFIQKIEEYARRREERNRKKKKDSLRNESPSDSKETKAN